MELQFAEHYFAIARERYLIRLRRLAGITPPWTEDQHLRTWRFCNVHREDDKTTEWFRDNVRNPADLYGPLTVTEATIAFRWFNRIETGEKIRDLFFSWDSKEAIRRLAGVSPVVTGAYIIKGYDGYSKLEGVCKAIDEALPQIPAMLPNWTSLESAWKDLKTINYLGGFMAYEIVSDLRWTSVLKDAPDINEWCNAGPGCARGISWVVDGHISPQRFQVTAKDQREMLPLMQELLAMSKHEVFWPQEWTPWEMREVEHWSCEYDKYCRARSGQSMKRRFRWN